jgi:hypothetical protein
VGCGAANSASPSAEAKASGGAPAGQGDKLCLACTSAEGTEHVQPAPPAEEPNWLGLAEIEEKIREGQFVKNGALVWTRWGAVLGGALGLLSFGSLVFIRVVQGQPALSSWKPGTFKVGDVIGLALVATTIGFLLGLCVGQLLDANPPRALARSEQERWAYFGALAGTLLGFLASGGLLLIAHLYGAARATADELVTFVMMGPGGGYVLGAFLGYVLGSWVKPAFEAVVFSPEPSEQEPGEGRPPSPASPGHSHQGSPP